MQKYLQILLISHSFFLVFSQIEEIGGANSNDSISDRSRSGFPINYYESEDHYNPSTLNHHSKSEDSDSSPYFQDTKHGDDEMNEYPDMDDEDEDEMQSHNPNPPLAAQDQTPGSAVGLGPTKQADENPLNFLNLAGTDFQPGRMVNIFFGLMIMTFMIVVHGYIMWIVGIAYLPGTRANKNWEFDPTAALDIVDSVLDAIQYWKDKQITE